MSRREDSKKVGKDFNKQGQTLIKDNHLEKDLCYGYIQAHSNVLSNKVKF